MVCRPLNNICYGFIVNDGLGSLLRMWKDFSTTCSVKRERLLQESKLRQANEGESHSNINNTNNNNSNNNNNRKKSKWHPKEDQDDYRARKPRSESNSTPAKIEWSSNIWSEEGRQEQYQKAHEDWGQARSTHEQQHQNEQQHQQYQNQQQPYQRRHYQQQPNRQHQRQHYQSSYQQNPSQSQPRETFNHPPQQSQDTQTERFHNNQSPKQYHQKQDQQQYNQRAQQPPPREHTQCQQPQYQQKPQQPQQQHPQPQQPVYIQCTTPQLQPQFQQPIPRHFPQSQATWNEPHSQQQVTNHEQHNTLSGTADKQGWGSSEVPVWPDKSKHLSHSDPQVKSTSDTRKGNSLLWPTPTSASHSPSIDERQPEKSSWNTPSQSENTWGKKSTQWASKPTAPLPQSPRPARTTFKAPPIPSTPSTPLNTLEDLATLQKNQPTINKPSNELPITEFKSDILKAVNENQVVIISGATGSGKTTQVPKYILQECSEKGQFCNIICTQPRRIAATSIAKRVAEELGEKVGNTVGYQIGMDKLASNANTKLLFVTTGILLQMLVHTKSLARFSHIILDEIHERDLDTDFALVIVKQLLASHPNVRLVLMSATFNCELFMNYFPLVRSTSNTRGAPTFTLANESVLSNAKSQLVGAPVSKQK